MGRVADWETVITLSKVNNHSKKRILPGKPALGATLPPLCCLCRYSWRPAAGTPWLWWWRHLPAGWTPAAPRGLWKDTPGTPSSCAGEQCGPSAAHTHRRTPPHCPAHSLSLWPEERMDQKNTWNASSPKHVIFIKGCNESLNADQCNGDEAVVYSRTCNYTSTTLRTLKL